MPGKGPRVKTTDTDGRSADHFDYLEDDDLEDTQELDMTTELEDD